MVIYNLKLLTLSEEWVHIPKAGRKLGSVVVDDDDDRSDQHDLLG